MAKIRIPVEHSLLKSLIIGRRNEDGPDGVVVRDLIRVDEANLVFLSQHRVQLVYALVEKGQRRVLVYGFMTILFRRANSDF